MREARAKIDLHAHTTASDGALRPAELVRLAAEAGIGILAVTDHDTTAGLAEAHAAGVEHGVTIVPGIEFGTEVDGTEVHMLAYMFDPRHEPLQAKLADLREGRLGRGKRMVEKLNRHGIAISWERVAEIASGASVGRPHVAQALVEAGHARTIDEAFELYIGRGMPGFVERTGLTPEECIALTHEAGGVAVLAHPTWVDNLETILPRLVAAGLDGMEAYYGRYTPDLVMYFVELAGQFGLVPTGGSDFHGLDGLKHAELGSVSVPPERFEDLVRRRRSRQ